MKKQKQPVDRDLVDRSFFARVEPFLYLLPFLIGIAVFTLYPVINVVLMSFKEGYSYLSRGFDQWGLANYQTVLSDPKFSQAIGNTLKYVILVVFVILLPAFVTNSLGMGDPFFCKYICPQGVLEGAIPLSLANSGIRAALGHLFTFKFTVLALFIILSILFYRPFCKWICPLGAIYSLFNKVSFLKIQVDHEKCVGCQKCSRVCKMDVNVVDTPNHPECIRCGECMKACPTDAICYHYGFSTKKQAENKN